jgi:serine protease Do
MRILTIAALTLIALGLPLEWALAEPSDETVFRLYGSVVKVHVDDENDNHGIGSGVVVAKDLVATNCHVIANARGVAVSKGGENYPPVALKADWQHDLCVLRFEGLPQEAVELGDSSTLKYEQPVFSVGYSNNAVKPIPAFGRIKALYTLDDSQIIRTSAPFMMGASGSALLDDQGRLIGINAFKSPGRSGYYYSLPVEWVKKLLLAPEALTAAQQGKPFWDAPEELRPFFMRVVPPLQAEKWAELRPIAKAWSITEPTNAEAWYYLGLSEDRQGNVGQALLHYHKALALNPQHAGALLSLGIISAHQGDYNELLKIQSVLNSLDSESAEALKLAISPAQTTTH